MARKRNGAIPAEPEPVVARDAVFQPEFREDLKHWVETERKTALRVLLLVEATLADPFDGIGKPEPLRYLGPNLWSRRITQEHRMVYRVSQDRIDSYKPAITTGSIVPSLRQLVSLSARSVGFIRQRFQNIV